ncbi:MAG: hypothetical protein AMJ56_07660 [Anaerolineae bacterium SG8_19]|nr:MAG: hypothetical protein AMJ56_07660 [Anaerolineae bacterium SG8_19]
MLIPKSKMPSVVKAFDFIIDAAEGRFDPPVETNLERDEIEMVKQMRDRAALCQHGDANFLEIEVVYGFTKP